MSIKFGPAGNAQSFSDAGFKATVDAPKWLSEMGLNAYEYQCGCGVTIGSETAVKIGEQAKIYGISMSLHSPYFINLSSQDPQRVEKNVKYILDSCRAARDLGAQRITVHCGGLGKLSRERAMQNTKSNVKLALDTMEDYGYGDLTLCLETMGKVNVLGNAPEVMELVAMDDRLLPCIDFGHLNARTMGEYNEYSAFKELFDLMENTIGMERARKFHSHFSKIEYSKGGEVRHLTYADTQYGPDFEPVAKLIVQRNYEPTVICESAGVQAEDAVLLKRIYESFKTDCDIGKE